KRIVNIFCLDTVVRDGAKPRRISKVARDPKTLLGASLRECTGVHPRGIDLERDDVRDDPIGVDPDAADLGESLGERLRVSMILPKTVAHLLEPDERRGRDDTGLSHRTAQELS